jgi:hypothetical protein
MSKGQLFLLSVIVIVFAIVGLQNAYNYSELPVLTEESRYSDAGSIAMNAVRELTYVIDMDPLNCTQITDFLGYVQDYTRERGYNVSVEGC